MSRTKHLSGLDEINNRIMESLRDLASCNLPRLSLTPAKRFLVFKRATHFRCSVSPCWRVSLGGIQPIAGKEPPPRCQLLWFLAGGGMSDLGCQFQLVTGHALAGCLWKAWPRVVCSAVTSPKLAFGLQSRARRAVNKAEMA